MEQTVAEVIKAINLEETALLNIFNLQNDLAQKAKTDSFNLEEFIAINKSVNRIVDNIREVQTMIQTKLQLAVDLLQKLESFDEEE